MTEELKKRDISASELIKMGAPGGALTAFRQLRDKGLIVKTHEHKWKLK